MREPERNVGNVALERLEEPFQGVPPVPEFLRNEFCVFADYFTSLMALESGRNEDEALVFQAAKCAIRDAIVRDMLEKWERYAVEKTREYSGFRDPPFGWNVPLTYYELRFLKDAVAEKRISVSSEHFERTLFEWFGQYGFSYSGGMNWRPDGDVQFIGDMPEYGAVKKFGHVANKASLSIDSKGFVGYGTDSKAFDEKGGVSLGASFLVPRTSPFVGQYREYCEGALRQEYGSVRQVLEHEALERFEPSIQTERMAIRYRETLANAAKILQVRAVCPEDRNLPALGYRADENGYFNVVSRESQESGIVRALRNRSHFISRMNTQYHMGSLHWPEDGARPVSERVSELLDA